LKFQAATNNSDPNSNDTPTPAQLDALCDPCVIQFVYRIAYTTIALGGNESDIEDELNFVRFSQYACVKDFSNNYCLPQIQTYNFSTLANPCLPGIVANSPTCSADCNNALTKAKHDLGCCFGTWFNFLTWQYYAHPTQYLLPVAPSVVRSFVNTTCKNSIPFGCAEDKVLLQLIISNVAWDWAQANQARVLNDLKNYLAYLLAVDILAIESITIAQAAAGTTAHTNAYKGFQLQASATSGISVSATIQPADSTQTSSITSTVQNSATSTSNPVTSTWPLSARADPTQGITTTSASAVSNPTSPNDAFTAYPSIVTLVFVFVAVLFL